jgi:hypothetical protein
LPVARDLAGLRCQTLWERTMVKRLRRGSKLVYLGYGFSRPLAAASKLGDRNHAVAIVRAVLVVSAAV